MSEADYYEHTVDWGLEQHLESRDQLIRFQVTAAMISPNAERLLDVGTGNGAFLSFLENASRPLHLRGLERSRSAIAASKCRAEITEGSVDALPFEDRSYDTVTALEVIEHLPYAVYPKALAEMARVSASQVVLSVPYRERRLMVDCPECGCRFSPIFHLRTFDEDKLEGLVPGFRLTAHEYVSTDVHWLLTDLATHLRGWRDRLKGIVPVPATCPQCGYALPTAKPDSSSKPTQPSNPAFAEVSSAKPLRSALLSWAPKVKRAHWLVAAYERVS